MKHVLDFLYEVTEEDKAMFGKHWIGPDRFEHFIETMVAQYKKDEGSDGQTAHVFCIACPARFYKIKAFAGKNSIGEEQGGYEVSMGSGTERLAATIAENIMTGMMGFKEAHEQA